MAVDYFGRCFPFGKFRLSALVKLVGDLAGNFDFNRPIHVEEKGRRRLLRLV